MSKAEKEPLISVIVPVYNVEKYLERCLDSIINQTYKNLQIIVVDDGSTDNSSKICDEYAKKDKRIEVYHKKNGGLSDARNYGIKKASGEWLSFVDSDDYLSKTFLKDLYTRCNKDGTSICVAPYIVATDNGQIYDESIIEDQVLSQKDALASMLLDKGFTVSAHSKIYKRELFEQLTFPKGKIFEDSATTYKVIMKCDRISYCSKGGYFYYKRSDSIINSGYNKKHLQFVEFTDIMCEAILKKYPELALEAESKKLDSRFSVLRRMITVKALSIDDKNDMEAIKSYILSKRRTILSGQYNKKIKMATIFLSLGTGVFKIGWTAYCKIKYGKTGVS